MGRALVISPRPARGPARLDTALGIKGRIAGTDRTDTEDIMRDVTLLGPPLPAQAAPAEVTAGMPAADA
jgi:hypothetical protein